MQKSKKILSLVLAGTFIIGSSTTVFAVTPQWTHPVPKIPVISNIEKFTLPYARCSEKLGRDEKS